MKMAESNLTDLYVPQFVAHSSWIQTCKLFSYLFSSLTCHNMTNQPFIKPRDYYRDSIQSKDMLLGIQILPVCFTRLSIVIACNTIHSSLSAGHYCNIIFFFFKKKRLVTLKNNIVLSTG